MSARPDPATEGQHTTPGVNSQWSPPGIMGGGGWENGEKMPTFAVTPCLSHENNSPLYDASDMTPRCMGGVGAALPAQTRSRGETQSEDGELGA